jgi:type I restriction enzyme, S subunit
VTSLPPGWTEATLADLARVVDPNPKHRNPKYVPIGFPFISTAEFTEPDGITLDTRNRVSEQTVREQEERCGFTDSSVVFARKGTIGKTRFVPEGHRFALLDSLCVINAGPAALPAYLRYAIAAPATQSRIAKSARGVALRQLSVGAVRDIVLPVAPLAQQRRIVAKLDSALPRLDTCCRRLDRVSGTLKSFRRSVLAAAMSGELTREWRDERGAVHEWPTVPLGKLLADVRYGTAKKCRYEPRAAPVLRIPNVADGIISHDDIKYAEFEDAERAKLELIPGDVLVIRSNGSLGLVGRPAVVTEREAGFLYAGYLIRLRLDPSRARPGFVARYLESPGCRSVIERAARSTTGVNNLNAEEIRRLVIPVPPLPEQDEIIRRTQELLGQADQGERRVARAVAALERVVSSVLRKAFRGELVPQDPNDEPASVMLERIRTQRPAENNEWRPQRRRPRPKARPRACPEEAPPKKRRAS